MGKVIEPISGENIKKALSSMRERIRRGKKVSIDLFLNEVGFGSSSCKHPIVRKCVDWGNLTRDYKKTNIYKELTAMVSKVVTTDVPTPADIIRIRGLLEKLRFHIIHRIARLHGEHSKGLRPLHAPGSVTYGEARNLYFGEQYDQAELYRLASRLCKSIAIGNTLSVYSDDEELMSSLREILASYLQSGISMEPAIIGASTLEVDKPFAVTMKFLLWIKEKSLSEQDSEKRRVLNKIVDRLKRASVTIFFAPGREKAKWRTLFIPRLDLFFTSWLDNDKRRQLLRNLIDSIINSSERIVRAASRRGQRAKVRRQIELVMHYYEMLCERLLEFGVIDYQSARNIVNLLTELAMQYDVKLSLTPWKWLT